TTAVLVAERAQAQARTTGSTGASSYGAGAQMSSGAGMFGANQMGGSFTPSASNFQGSAAGKTQGSVIGRTQQQDNAGQILGNERFVRGNRRGNQFIGQDA